MSTVKEPKYASLAAQIREQIENKVLRPGDKLPTMAEMRVRHGITPTTAAKVYSVLQQEGLIECGRGRGSFVAMPPAKTLTGTIGVSGLISRKSNDPYTHPFTARLMQGFIEAAANSGVQILILNDASAPDWERIDGVLLHGVEGVEVLRKLPPNMPVVGTLVSVPDAVCVVADERAGIHALVKHLVSLGHRRIAAIMDPNSPQRISAYRDALGEAGIEPDSRWLRHLSTTTDLDYGGRGGNAIANWLSEDWRELGCTAIVAQNDDTAHGIIEVLRQKGVRVPTEVSVTGFDGTEGPRHLRPFLTTIEVPLHQVGVASMELLLQQIGGENIRTSTISLPVALKVGESTAAARPAL